MQVTRFKLNCIAGILTSVSKKTTECVYNLMTAMFERTHNTDECDYKKTVRVKRTRENSRHVRKRERLRETDSLRTKSPSPVVALTVSTIIKKPD